MKKIFLISIIIGTGLLFCGKNIMALEFRTGSINPGKDLTAMSVKTSQQTVYISAEPVLSNHDIASSRFIEATDKHPHYIELVFTPTGAKRLEEATEHSIGKPLCLLHNGRLLNAPIVREKISSGVLIISGGFSEDEAKSLIRSIPGS